MKAARGTPASAASLNTVTLESPQICLQQSIFDSCCRVLRPSNAEPAPHKRETDLLHEVIGSKCTQAADDPNGSFQVIPPCSSVKNIGLQDQYDIILHDNLHDELKSHSGASQQACHASCWGFQTNHLDPFNICDPV